MEWKTYDTAPESAVVMTKIDDQDGVRNEQPLKKIGNLWYISDGSMYVYHRPTHWRPMTPAEIVECKDRLRRELARVMDAHAVSYMAESGVVS